MSFKEFFREIRDGMGSKSGRSVEGRYWRNRTRSSVVPDHQPPSEPAKQGRWANIPPELLLDIIKRLEASETTWPARTSVISCAAVCKSWREITHDIVRTPEECGRLTFPISLKQPGPRDSPIQCFVRRDGSRSTYYLHIGLTPSEGQYDKLLLAAKKVRRPTGIEFVISLVSDDFSRRSNKYLGKLRSNFLGTKFHMYDGRPSGFDADAGMKKTVTESEEDRRKGSVSYELNLLRTRGPRRMHCVMRSIPLSSIRDGGTAPTPSSFRKDDDGAGRVHTAALVLKNKPPRWHEQLQCWCLNFKGRVTVASVKNFQLVADVGSSDGVSPAEQDRVMLQFGKIGQDIFTMDYRYPLSAFQAFAICLSSFDTKPACE